jgi:hypothetical protein
MRSLNFVRACCLANKRCKYICADCFRVSSKWYWEADALSRARAEFERTFPRRSVGDSTVTSAGKKTKAHE